MVKTDAIAIASWSAELLNNFCDALLKRLQDHMLAKEKRFSNDLKSPRFS